LLVEYGDEQELLSLLSVLNGQLTGTIIGNEQDQELPNVISILRKKCGRLILNGVPTGVNVLSTMHHGGPYPSSSDSRFTAVGQKSVYRFIRPVTFQNF
jgi:NADP-dependent aldehyde dehydrogenase